jgi:hypothetical protein
MSVELGVFDWDTCALVCQSEERASMLPWADTGDWGPVAAFRDAQRDRYMQQAREAR